MGKLAEEFAVMLNGECAERQASFQPIVLTRLAKDHCVARMMGRAPLAGTEVDVWIGALGPLGASVDREQAEGGRLMFLAPLPAKVLQHFSSL